MADILRPVTAFPATRTKRPRRKVGSHLEFIRSLPCVVSGMTPVDAAHIRFGDESYAKRETGMGEKPNDWWTVPLHRDLHQDQHAHNEREWWASKRIDPLKTALILYANSGDHETCSRYIEMWPNRAFDPRDLPKEMAE